MPVTRAYTGQELMTLREAMNRLFEDSFVTPNLQWREGEQKERRLPLDVYMTDEEIVIVASLPGLTPDEVNILIESDELTIRGELRRPLENVDYIFQERPSGTYSRTLTLNVPVDADRAEAMFENGVLTLILPKGREAKPKTIKVSSE